MTDWVDVWDGLHGSRDFRAVVEAGSGLRDIVVLARSKWTDREAEHLVKVHALEDERDAARHELSTLSDECASLAEVVRTWHDRAHTDSWLICGNVVCRAASIEYPDVRPVAALELVKGVV